MKDVMMIYSSYDTTQVEWKEPLYMAFIDQEILFD